MSYKLDGRDIVISGWQDGIADDPYSGIADIRNANISSTPGEVSVNFSTALRSFPSLAAVSISSADSTTEILTITSSPTLASGMTVTLTGSTLPAGLATGTIYWVIKVSNTTMKLASSYVNYAANTPINITTNGTPGNWTFTTINLATPKYFTTDNQGVYWMVDCTGRVWIQPTQDGSGTWIYTGNQVPSSSYTSGNGILFFQAVDSANRANNVGYIFVFHNGSVDYTLSATGGISWNYQWNPNTGTLDGSGYQATPTNVLKSGRDPAFSHEAAVAPNGRSYFCDLNYVATLYQTDPAVIFVPTTLATYTFTETVVLPPTDTAQCLTFLGASILVGGQLNVVYVWDGVAPTSNNFILLPESNIAKMVTVIASTYIFAGNRGRIYITNGGNANLFKKIPDNISGVLEPYFQWGGATFQKNRLYFGFYVTANDASFTNKTSLYAGLWSIDTDTKALVGSNQLSPGTAVYASAIIGINPSYPTFISNPFGAGLYIGWTSTPLTTAIGTTGGVDTTSSTPYSNGETLITTDMIPVGTYLNQVTSSQVEWKTSYPIGVNGTVETIAVYYRTALNQSFTLLGTTSVTGTSMVGSTTGTSTGSSGVSDYYIANFQKIQWIQLQIAMSSNATTPTFNRLTEVRIRDFGGKK